MYIFFYNYRYITLVGYALPTPHLPTPPPPQHTLPAHLPPPALPTGSHHGGVHAAAEVAQALQQGIRKPPHPHCHHCLPAHPHGSIQKLFRL